jgi:hypothetical protein
MPSFVPGLSARTEDCLQGSSAFPVFPSPQGFRPWSRNEISRWLKKKKNKKKKQKNNKSNSSSAFAERRGCIGTSVREFAAFALVQLMNLRDREDK